MTMIIIANNNDIRHFLWEKKMKMLHKVMQYHSNVFILTMFWCCFWMFVMSTVSFTTGVSVLCFAGNPSEWTHSWVSVCGLLREEWRVVGQTHCINRQDTEFGLMGNLLQVPVFILSPIPSLLFPDLCKLSNTCPHLKEEETAHED